MMKKKILSLAVLLAMLLQMFAPVNFAVAVDNEVPSECINVTESKLTISDNLNNVITPTKDEKGNWVYTDIPKDAKIDIKYAFTLKDDNGDPDHIPYEYTSEQAISVEMPAGVDFSSTVPAEGQPVKVSEDVTMGTLKMVGNAAVIYFHGYEYVDNHNSMGGAFHISGSFDESVQNAENPAPITFVFDGKTYKINVKKKDPVTPPDPSFKVNMSKKGEYDSATNTITWTVTLTPVGGAGKSISVEDVYSVNQQYIDKSFAVDDVAVTSGPTHDAANHKLTYVFLDDIPENTTKVIKYKTKPTTDAFVGENGASETVDFTNTATVKSESTDKGTAQAKIRFNWIQKSGTFDSTTLRVHWKVDINKNYTAIDSEEKSSDASNTVSNPVVTDTLPEGMTLVSNSVKFNGSFVPSGDYTYNSASRALIYSHSGTIIGQKTLEFDTYVVNANLYLDKNGKTDFKNTAKLEWTENTGGTPSCETIVGVGKSVIAKSATGKPDFVANGKNKEDIITWTIAVNENTIQMAKPLVTDDIPTGLEYIDNSCGLYDSAGDPVSEGTFKYDSDKRSICYEFDTDITDTYFIKFKTKVTNYSDFFVNSNAVTCTNTATVTSPSLKDGKQSATASKSFTSEVISKSVLTGENNLTYDYLTKRIKWQIVVNRNKIPMTNAVISDTMPEGMKFVASTFEVRNEKGDSVTPGTLESINVGDDVTSSKDSFKYTFSGTGDKQKYIITYETEMKEKYLKENQFAAPKSFINTADISASNYSGTVSSSANQQITNPIIEKKTNYLESTNRGDTMDWIVPINIAQTNWHEGIEISDVLQEELGLDIDSVKLYHMKLNSNGTLTKSVLAPKTEYDVLYKNKKLTLSIHGPVTGAYQLEFTTDVLSEQATINNSITFKGSAISAQSTSSSVAVNLNDVNSSFYGKQGKVSISKVDEADNNVKLSGATFQLYDINKIAILGKMGTTDANGQLVFDSLKLRTYYIGEISAPDGYLLDNTLRRVKLDPNILNLNATFSDKKGVADIEFQKQTAAGKPLAGAEFTLYSKGSTIPLKTALSDNDGKVVFTGVEVGDYEIKESKAPEGYNITTETIGAEVEIVNDGTTAKATLSKNVIKNTPKGNPPPKDNSSDFEFQKQTAAGKPLAGAEFALYSNGSTVPLKTAVSDNNGKVVFKGVAVGDYQIKETKAPGGYKISTDIIDVKVEIIKGEANASLSKNIIKNDLLPVTPPPTPSVQPTPDTPDGKVVVIKTDEHGKLLSGAKIALCRLDGMPIKSGVTGDDGKLYFDGIISGSYIVKEIEAPKGYELNSTAYQVFIKEDLKTISIINKEVVKEEPGTITIIKKGDSGEVLEGAGFTLADSNGTVIATGLTDKNGYLKFSNINAGTYSITEFKVPEGYISDSTPLKITVASNEGKEVTISNKKQEKLKVEEKGSVAIRKTDGGSELLSDAEFLLINASGKTIASGKTDNKGELTFSDIPVGSYTIIEIKAPKGYAKDVTSIKVTVENKQTKDIVVVNKKEMPPKEGSTVVVNKIDGKSKPLEGAEFTLYDMHGKVLAKYVSDAKGRVIFEKLKEGNYELQETKAPEGYTLVSKKLHIKIEKDKLLKLTFRDIRIEEVDSNKVPLGWIDIGGDIPKIPQAGEWNDTFVMLVAGAGLVCVGGIWLAVCKRRKKAD